MTRACTFRLTGRVQGVGFRHWTVETARDLGLSGWVRNESDGAVTGHAEGAAEPMRRFQEALGQGPTLARVESVSVDSADPQGMDEFETR